jgi:hypothetical protein
MVPFLCSNLTLRRGVFAFLPPLPNPIALVNFHLEIKERAVVTLPSNIMGEVVLRQIRSIP